MYGLYGVSEVVRNLYLLTASRGDGVRSKSLYFLRSEYLRFLRDYLPEMPVNSGDSIFIFDENIEAALITAYSSREKNSLDDMHQDEIILSDGLPSYYKQKYAGRVALALLDMGLEDKTFELVFRLVIHSIFLRASKPLSGIRKSFGGSSGGALGTIWLVPDKILTRYDQMELLVHELTHHLLFIDEMVHPQFDYSKIALKKYYAYSAILKTSRPLDKVIHSIVVGVEILLWRMRSKIWDGSDTIVHPCTADLVQQILHSLDSLYSIPNLDHAVKPRVFHILNRCQEVCGAFSNN